jgi:hypothetical protein
MEISVANYNPNNTVAVQLLEKLSRVEDVHVKINYVLPEEEKSPYNPEFVKKILESRASKEEVRYKDIEEFKKDLWKLY